MVLYHAISIYQMLCAVIHSTGVKEHKTLFLPSWITNTMKNVDRLKLFFDEVHTYDANFYFAHSRFATDKYVTATFGPLKQYKEIFVWGATYTLGICLAEKNIRFTYCEEAPGLLSTPERLEGIERKLGREKTVPLVKRLGLYDGTVRSASAVMCNLKVQKGPVSTNKEVIDFDPVEMLSHMDSEVRAEIVSTFSSASNIPIPDNAVCILTQHFANLRLLTFDEQVLIYQLLVDYFFPDDRIVFKPHPSDILYYGRLFPEADVIRETFPTELLPYIFDKKPKTVATISSTATLSLRGQFRQIFELDENFEKDFTSIHRYYAAVKLCRELGKPCMAFHADTALAEHLCERENVPYLRMDQAKNAGDMLVIVDDVGSTTEEGRSEAAAMLEGLESNACAVLINTKQTYCWYDYYKKELWEHMVPVVLEKRCADGRNQADEVIYVYSKNNDLLEEVRAVEIRKDLKNTGLSIEKKPLTPEQERIAILEGLLAATENRLLHYIGQEKSSE